MEDGRPRELALSEVEGSVAERRKKGSGRNLKEFRQFDNL
jgi:hypothetical protein